jgi:hypothetical protein
VTSVLLLLSACATAPQSVGETALTPLSDLNLVRTEIPQVLRDAARNPYAEPESINCQSIAAIVISIDAILGKDLDVDVSDTGPSLLERGTEAAGSAAIAALRRTAESAIPFRSWVRKLTGAESHAKEAAAAIVAGSIRRAYLKGLGQAIGCTAPAAPLTTR